MALVAFVFFFFEGCLAWQFWQVCLEVGGVSQRRSELFVQDTVLYCSQVHGTGFWNRDVRFRQLRPLRGLICFGNLFGCIRLIQRGFNLEFFFTAIVGNPDNCRRPGCLFGMSLFFMISGYFTVISFDASGAQRALDAALHRRIAPTGSG